MDAIEIVISRDDVYEEVAKATDYTGSKIPSEDDEIRDRILATDEDLAELGRFWEESVEVANECLKEFVNDWTTSKQGYTIVLEVSVSFNKKFKKIVEEAVRSFFINSIIGGWFGYVNKEESGRYIEAAASQLEIARRILYSRMKPNKPKL